MPKVRCRRATKAEDLYLRPDDEEMTGSPDDGVCRWGFAGQRRINRYTLHAVREFAAWCENRDGGGPEAWDGPRLRTALAAARADLGWCPATHNAVRAVLWRYRTHPEVDRDGRFQSHLHAVPAAFLDEHPALWHFPWSLARRLLRLAADPDDVQHLVLFVQDVTNRRLLRLPRHRSAERARASITRRFLWIMRMLEAGWEPDTTWRHDRLPATLDLPGLLDRLARAVGHMNRHGARPRRRATTPTVTDPAALLLAFFRTSVRDGVFEPRIPCHHSASVNAIQVARRVQALADAQPDRYASAPPVATRHHPPCITAEDVGRLWAACRTHRERAFLALVSTTGLRACAVGAARVADVWCQDTGRLRECFHFLEKNCEIRTVWPTPELREHLAAYLGAADEHPGVDVTPLLFPSARRPREPSATVARGMLQAICMRVRPGPAPRFTPHLFRHFLVNTLLREGHRLECIAKWLGHRSPDVTYRHYWTDPEMVRPKPPPAQADDDDDDDDGTLFVALETAVDECERLRAEVARLQQRTAT